MSAQLEQDEQAIRQVVAEWMSATRRGDTRRVLELMTEDALFLGPGRPPMDKSGFAAASASQTSAPAPQIDGNSDIREIHVEGNLAYLWSALTVTVTPTDGSPAMRREGHTLTIFRKERGRWLLARDANMLVKVQG